MYSIRKREFAPAVRPSEDFPLILRLVLLGLIHLAKVYLCFLGKFVFI